MNWGNYFIKVRLAFVFALCTICCAPVLGATFRVPEDYPTLQSAIEMALAGDTVSVTIDFTTFPDGSPILGDVNHETHIFDQFESFGVIFPNLYPEYPYPAPRVLYYPGSGLITMNGILISGGPTGLFGDIEMDFVGSRLPDSITVEIIGSGLNIGARIMAFNASGVLLNTVTHYYYGSTGQKSAFTLSAPQGETIAKAVFNGGLNPAAAASIDNLMFSYVFEPLPPSTERYSITSLGTLGGLNSYAWSINDVAQVVGQSEFDLSLPFDTHAFIWDSQNGMQDLVVLSGSQCEARDINNVGVVVGAASFGESQSPMHAFVWDSQNGMQDLGTFGGMQSNAEATNNAGEVVGTVSTGGYSGYAFLWTPAKGLTNLGNLGFPISSAWGINDIGQIVGVSHVTSTNYHAFIWDAENGMRDLGAPNGYTDSMAMDVNNLGQVVGDVQHLQLPNGTLINRAFIWDAENGMQLLPTLGGWDTSAHHINDHGQVVGYSTIQGAWPPRAFIWSKEHGMRDLNDLLPPNSPLTELRYAYGINNVGQIVGEGLSPAQAFIMTPVKKLTAIIAGTGSGTLSAPGLSCAADTCSGDYPVNSTVIVIATATLGSTFNAWSACDSVNGNICAVTMAADKSVSASFTLDHRVLAIKKSGDGTGIVTASGINCGTDCTETYWYGTEILLTAIADRGSAFSGWSGCDSVNGNVCTVLMNANTSVTARFVLNDTKKYELTVRKKLINKGDGLVVSDDGAISCGDECAGSYYANTSVTLRAIPSPGSVFEGWTATSLNCGTSSTCSFTMNNNNKVKAIFRGPYRLSTKVKTKNGGSGSVTSDISGTGAGINCSASSCQDYYPYGTNVGLTAQPSGGSQFLGWKPSSLGCGTDLACNVPMNKKWSVTATFEGM